MNLQKLMVGFKYSMASDQDSCMMKQLMYPWLPLMIGKNASSRFGIQTPKYKISVQLRQHNKLCYNLKNNFKKLYANVFCA